MLRERRKGETGETPREESYFKPHSSSNPNSRDTARQRRGTHRQRTSRSSAATTSCSPLNEHSLTPLLTAAAGGRAAHSTQRPASGPASPKTPSLTHGLSPPSLKSEERAQGCRARLRPALCLLSNTPPGRGDRTIVQWLRSPHSPASVTRGEK